MDYVNSFVCDQVLTNSKMGLDTSSSFQKCLNHAQNNNDYSSQYYMGYFYELGIELIKILMLLHHGTTNRHLNQTTLNTI